MIAAFDFFRYICGQRKSRYFMKYNNIELSAIQRDGNIELRSHVVYFFSSRHISGRKINREVFLMTHKSPIRIHKELYDTVERAYWCMKMMLACSSFRYGIFMPEQIRMLVHRKSVMDVKRIARTYKYSDEAMLEWEQWEEFILLMLNLLKFTACSSSFTDELLKTDDKFIAYAHPNDKVLGINMNESDALYSSRTPADWKGRNLLGQALMEVRDIIRGTNDTDTVVDGDQNTTVVLKCEKSYLLYDWSVLCRRIVGIPDNAFNITHSMKSLAYDVFTVNIYLKKSKERVKVVNSYLEYLRLYPGLEVICN